MADYIYLLENRLSTAQQAAIKAVRDVARSQGLTVFLVGGAVRDLTSGSPVRDLDVAVQGNALKLKKALELSGGVITGDNVAGQSLFARFAGGVRIEIGSTLSVTFPKPGKPVMKAATILDDLRSRDFTVNAMALSLNEGSYGLLMDPLNGVADIENRLLRLVSNYGFIEDPVRMIRAARFAARLGWMMDEKTQARYDSGKEENYIEALSDFDRGYETEEIFHEEDPLRILRKLEDEGWMKHLFPALTAAKANSTELEKLRDIQTQLQVRDIHPEAAAANFPLVTAKLTAKEIADLKRSFVRPGFVQEIDSLESEAKEFSAQLLHKNATSPSQSWKLLEAAKPEAVLWVAYSTKSGAIQAKLRSFYTEWPQARAKIPYALMQEMRIVPDLPVYAEVVEKLFYELMDGRLDSVEEMKAYLESYSPPAPPPPVHLRRARAAKKDAKAAKSRKKAVAATEDDDDLDASPKNAMGEDDDDGIDAEIVEAVAGDEDDISEPIAEPAPPAPPANPLSAKPPLPVVAPEVEEEVASKTKKTTSPKKTILVRAPEKLQPKSTPAKPIPPSKPSSPAKVKAGPAHKASSVKRIAPAARTKTAPAKKVAAGKKAVMASPKKSSVPPTKTAKAAAPVRKATPAKKAGVKTPSKKSAPAKKIALKTAKKAVVKKRR